MIDREVHHMANEAKEKLQQLFEKLSDNFVGTVEQDYIRSEEDGQPACMDLTLTPEVHPEVSWAGPVRVRVSLITTFLGHRLTGRETIELARVQARTGTFTDSAIGQTIGEEVFVSVSPLSALINIIMSR
jgi:hypothetical protein